MVSLVYWSLVSCVIGLAVYFLVRTQGKDSFNLVDDEAAIGRLCILVLLISFAITLPVTFAIPIADIVGAEVPLWIRPMGGPFFVLTPAVISFGTLLFVGVPLGFARQYRRTGSLREANEKPLDTLQTIVGVMSFLGIWLLLVAWRFDTFFRFLDIAEPSEFFDVAKSRAVGDVTVTKYHSSFVRHWTTVCAVAGGALAIAGGCPAWLLHKFGFGSGNPKLIKNPAARIRAENAMQERKQLGVLQFVIQWTPMTLVGLSVVYAVAKLIYRPWDNGANLMLLASASILGSIIVVVLRRRPYFSWPLSFPLALNVQFAVEYGSWASAAVPFLLVWCAGWWRQEHGKRRNPWPGFIAGAIFCAFALAILPFSIMDSHRFLRVREIAPGSLVRAEVTASNGNKVEITDSEFLEELRKALTRTYPYHSGREHWIENYQLALYCESHTPTHVLRMKYGNSANEISFWISAPEGEFQNVALCRLLRDRGVITELGKSPRFD